MEESIKLFKIEIEKALRLYPSENIDIVEDEELFILMYHSRHNSFRIGEFEINSANMSETNREELIKNLDDIADYYELGTVYDE